MGGRGGKAYQSIITTLCVLKGAPATWSPLLQGVLEDLRAQLKASMVSHETMQSQSAALAELQHQMHTMAKLQQELMTQARVIGSLKTQIGASAEQHRQLICQVCSQGLLLNTYIYCVRFTLHYIRHVYYKITTCIIMWYYICMYIVSRLDAKIL